MKACLLLAICCQCARYINWSGPNLDQCLGCFIFGGYVIQYMYAKRIVFLPRVMWAKLPKNINISNSPKPTYRCLLLKEPQSIWCGFSGLGLGFQGLGR